MVATDLRGYGDARKPPGGDDHSGYSFRAMAQDQVEVMARSASTSSSPPATTAARRVLHRMCLDHPDKVERAAILDIIPQHHLFNNITRDWATFSWHWFFNIQPAPMPEKMMGADPDWFIQKKLAKTPAGLSFFGPEALAEYKRCFRNPETIHAICEDYRACAGVDLDMDTKDFEAGRKIACPAAAPVGRDRRRRPQPQPRLANLAALCRRHPRRQGAAVRALSVRGSAGGNLSGAPRVLSGQSDLGYCCGRHLKAGALP